MKTAIIGVDAKIQINGALLQIGNAFSSALPSAKIAAERLSSCFKDLGKQFVCRIKTLKTSRRQFKRIRMKMFFREKQHEIFSAKQGCSQVNDNRKAARLRRLYHRCADWICPKWQLNEKLCEHCQHLYRCYAKLSWLINAWPGPVNLQGGGWRYVPRSRAKACE